MLGGQSERRPPQHVPGDQTVGGPALRRPSGGAAPAGPTATRAATAALDFARRVTERGPVHRRHVHLQVDPVEQRPGQPPGVGPDLHRLARAVEPLAVGATARARVGREDEQEARRVAHHLARTGDHHLAGLERLAQGLQHRALELGASSRKSTPWWAREIAPGRTTPEPPPATAAIEALWCGATNGGVRSSSTTSPTCPVSERMAWVSRACSRLSGRQHRDQPLGEHRLADAGRPGHQQVVPSGGRQLEGQPRLRLPDDVGEVGAGPRPAPAPTGGGGAGGSGVPCSAARVPVDDVAQAAGAVHGHPVDELGLPDVLDRHDDVPWPRSAPRRGPRAARRAPPGPARRAPARRGGRRRATRPRRITPAADSTATAMARSKLAPRLGIDAGERFTVTRCGGTGTPLVAAADRTRSGACAHAASGMPPIAKCGSPWATCASTSTTVPSSPVSATDRVCPSPWLTTPPRRRAGRTAGRPGRHRMPTTSTRTCAARSPPAVPGEVGRREPPQPHGLGEGDGLDRLAEPRRPAGLDLADDEAVAVAGDDVDLAVLAAPVAVEHLHALLAQVAHGQRLAVAAQARAGPRRAHGRGRADGRGRAGRAARWRVGAGHDRSQPAGTGAGGEPRRAPVDDDRRAAPLWTTPSGELPQNSPLGSSSSLLASSSTLTSLNVTTRTVFANRAGR